RAKWEACIGEASGSHEVPDPCRVSGMPSGPSVMDIGCCMCICERAGDGPPASNASAAPTRALRVMCISRSPPQVHVEAVPRVAAKAHKFTASHLSLASGEIGG